MIRWTEPAQADFLGIMAWIQTNDPIVAERVGREILGAVSRLEDFPKSGRPGRSPDTRELVVSRLPYLVVYQTEDSGVAVLRVLHGARQWPLLDPP